MRDLDLLGDHVWGQNSCQALAVSSGPEAKASHLWYSLQRGETRSITGSEGLIEP